MKQFAKLFEFEDLGQVLVMLDRGDDGPEVRSTSSPTGLASVQWRAATSPAMKTSSGTTPKRGSPRWTPKGLTRSSPRQWKSSRIAWARGPGGRNANYHPNGVTPC